MATLSARAVRSAREHGQQQLRRALLLLVALLLVLSGRPTEERHGASGRSYEVFRESERWTPGGPAVTVRYRSAATSRAAASREVADLLPELTARADSAGLARLVVRANSPLLSVGWGAAVYREWRFRYVRDSVAWKPERVSSSLR